MRLSFPIAVKIQDDETMEDIMDRLDLLGFMSRYSMTAIYPYVDLLDWFYQETGTYPTYFLLTSEDFDPVADGLSVELCGEHELDMAKKTLLDEDIRYLDFDRFANMLNSWEARQ